MRKIFLVVTLLITIIILGLNFKLMSGKQSSEAAKDDILLQLNFLETELKYNDLGARMQSIFPEGLVFINALYGLTWCELALAESSNLNLKNKAVNEALYAFKEIDSDKAQKSFPNYTRPKFGIFYNGWRNYLLSKILLVDIKFEDSDLYMNKFADQCDKIERAILSLDSPYLESYDSLCWPADTFVAIASLANYDITFTPRHNLTIKNWLTRVNNLLDKSTGMIPHRVNPNTGLSLGETRGSSMSLMLRMLTEIDAHFADIQYRLFKEQFVTEIVGLPIVREYPKGIKGYGDVDSGPVILGIGSVATIVSSGFFSMYNDYDLSPKQHKTINALGLEIKTKTEKKYIFGLMPMADAFIAWGRASELNIRHEFMIEDKFIWLPKFHLISGLILLLSWIIYFRNYFGKKLRKL